MFVEGATSPFQIPCSGSRTCYSFGEKNSRLLLVRSVHKNMRSARRALLNAPGPVLLGAIVSEKKILKEKCFFPLVPLNRYNSAPIGPICTQKIWSVRRALSTDLSPVLVGAIVSEKKIRARQALSNDPNPVLVGAIVSEKKIVKKNFFPLFFLNCYSSAPIGPIWTKKICAQRARGVLSNDQGSVLLGTIV
ncbi:LOW QUALITY PROTEIN: hypothetical protein V1477_006397 [Vespula maculifrons]|uniref:Uncharacterized protein n=1 Tax=Vespula maculifrons TaxID=7453 RepID=A0ABD2CKA9_VESMC